MTEKELEARLVSALKSYGGYARKAKWLGVRGAPDRRCYVAGYSPFWVELKTEKGRLSEHQVREVKEMRKSGESVLVVKGVAQVELLIASIGRAEPLPFFMRRQL